MTSQHTSPDAVTPAALSLPGVSDELSARLAEGLARVDALLSEKVALDDPFVAEAAGHLMAAGGKRFRPLLTLLAAELADGCNDEVVTAAAAVELTHLASLYHDDVMDDALLRRGSPSANAKYDNSTAILVGDLLFGTASELVSDLGPHAVKIHAQTFVRLCSGQIRDDRPSPDGEDPVAYYLGVLADKTGVLIATAARYGGMFGGSSPEVVEILRQYGEAVGITFQLADDVIDIAEDYATLGKAPGTDLREGKATLPVLFARESVDPADDRLKELLAAPLAADSPELAEALGLLRAHPALARAREQAHRFARGAVDHLAPLPDGEVKQALAALAIRVVERVG